MKSTFFCFFEATLTMMKIISMFSVVRGYNIPVVVLAQYLSAVYIFAPHKRALSVVLDGYLFLIVVASSLTIASGYIINNFYDYEKDPARVLHINLYFNFSAQ